jgi:long-chain acyl-CoA synthetase
VKVAEDGELLVKGPNVMKGYYQNEAATREVLEPDGWFHTGDIGEIDQDGAVRITDRKKDLIKTSGGKYCAPQNLEGALKGNALVSNAMVHGDLRPYLVALLCVSEEGARKLLGGQVTATTPYAELAKHPQVQAALEQVVAELNATLPPYSTLKRFAVMDHDFTQESGELTPTLKVKRKFCAQKYAAQLEALYSGAAA